MLIEGMIAEEVKTAITDMLEDVIKAADKYGEDRDILLAKVGTVVQNMIEMATFKQYQPGLKKAPQTRIEHIRAMSVEEMADAILQRGEISTVIDYCQSFGECCETIPEAECKKCLIKWLNSSPEQKKGIQKNYYTERFNRVQ